MILKASPVTSSRISRAILASWGVLGGTVISKFISAEVGEGVLVIDGVGEGWAVGVWERNGIPGTQPVMKIVNTQKQNIL
jgi:hypothetical protein